MNTLNKSIIKKVDCIRLYVADLESGLSFYKDKLGLALLWRSEDEAGLGLADDVTEIVLHTEPKKPEIDLKVDQVDEATALIEEAGGKIVAGPFEIKIGQCVVISDPWNNELILLDSSKGLLATNTEGHVIGNLPKD
jgi:predicted enzyme related to lactoylglutathione lyase